MNNGFWLLLILACLAIFGAAYWNFRRSERVSSDQIHDASKTLERAIADTILMLRYASSSGISLAKQDVDAVVILRRGISAATPDQEAAFWQAASNISKAISPCTTDSLIATSSESGLAARTARKYRYRTIVTLGLLLLFQIYWLVGATLVSDLREIRTNLENLQKERLNSLLTEANFKQDAPDFKDKKIKLDVDRQSFTDRLEVNRISAQADFGMLRKWNIANEFLIDKSSINQINAAGMQIALNNRNEKIENDRYFLWEFTPENVTNLQTSQIILTSILKYILPILYGALGASAFIVRNLAAEIKEYTYSLGSTVRYQLRFYLGSVAGLSIAWFISDPKSGESAGLLPSLSPLALAFLAGYSVELLFSLLDRLVTAFSTVDGKK